ncbi:MAG: hypothetical protein M5U01_15375 [Ardenticatenaceae bacterium]|nr:hypothetical protein [Ardenticatenaceae bacterium]
MHDDDGEGIRGVDVHTMEGLHNFLRSFHDISKHFLDGYLAVFEWAHNLKIVTADFLVATMVPFASVAP